MGFLVLFTLQVLLMGQSVPDPFDQLIASGREAYARSNFTAADARFTEAKRLYAGGDPRRRAIILGNLGAAHQALGREPEAETEYLEAVRIWKTLGEEGLEPAITIRNLAALRRSQQAYQESEQLHGRAIEMLEKLFGPDNPRMASGLIGLGKLYANTGRRVQSEAAFRRALALSGVDPSLRADALSNLAELLLSAHKFQDADSLLQEAIGLTESAYGRNHPNVAYSCNGLAHSYLMQGRYKQAEPLLRRALAIYDSTGVTGAELIAALNNLGQALRFDGKRKEALHYLERALHAWEKQLGSNHPNVASTLLNLAEVHASAKEYEMAEIALARALAIDEARFKAEDPVIARDLAHMASLHSRRKLYVEAEREYRRALEIQEASNGPYTAEHATWLENHAIVLRHLENYADAAKSEARAMGIRVKQTLRERTSSLVTRLN